MKTWFRMRANASLIFTAAALGAALLVSPAGAQEQWRTPTNYRGYDNDRLITPSAQATDNQPQPNWDNHVARVAQLENQLESLQTTRVAELEAEIARMNERMTSSGDSVYNMGGVGGSCNTCATNCCPSCPQCRCGFYGGIEFLFLKPHFEDSTLIISSQNGGIGNRSNARSHDADYDYDLATRVILGWNDECGLGFRTRFFNYDYGSDRAIARLGAGGVAETPAIQPILGNGQQFFMGNAGAPEFVADHSMELQTWDFEVTNQMSFANTCVTVGGGLRYAMMEQRYRAHAQWPDNGPIQETLRNDHDFHGFGPTLAFEMLRSFDCCRGLSLYFNARGSALFGESDQVYRKTNPLGVPAPETYTRNDTDASLYIAELGLGVQYTRGCFFGRAGWEGQYWNGVGGPTSNTGNMGLQGLSLMLGMNY